jgi:ribosomal protein S18 acetylase RimI-like enzyme/phosphoglycolate phosphatase-like HAD superfamily hydrolase
MNLVVFDIDGTLTESVAIDELCFLQAFRDVLGIEQINTNWLEYAFQTDSGLALEICRKHLDRDPSDDEIGDLRSRFVHLLCAAVEQAGQPIREIPGAAALLHGLKSHAKWRIAIATGGWEASARFKLASACLPMDAFPWANADDALDRIDILRTAIRRAAQVYGQDTFEKIVYVGDGIWDVRAAGALKIGFIGLARGNKTGRLLEAGASCVLPDFSDPVHVTECLEAVARNPFVFEQTRLIRQDGSRTDLLECDTMAEKQLIVRAYVESDEGQVIQLWRDAFPDNPSWKVPKADIDRKLGVQRELFLVGDLDGEIVGTVMAGFDGHRGWVHLVAVARKHRQQGFGRAMMIEAEKKLREIGCTKINLQVRATNQGVVSFYEKLGYAVEERVSMGKRLS